MPKKKSPLSVMDAAYEAANKRCTEALLAGVDIDDAILGLEAAYEAANMRYTNALMRRSTRDLPHSANAMPADEVVTADARFADENEEINCNFVAVARIVE